MDLPECECFHFLITDLEKHFNPTGKSHFFGVLGLITALVLSDFSADKSAYGKAVTSPRTPKKIPGCIFSCRFYRMTAHLPPFCCLCLKAFSS
ncbi:MAG: hypothetical protein HY774_19820 [Acidobacteria bacterium]|nr:hypothetical protein [Acidobacteriota bacterium]